MIKKITYILLLGIISLSAKEKSALPEKTSAKNFTKVEAQLRDKTFIVGQLDSQEIQLKTPHGDLNIKVPFIRRIEFGLKASTIVRAKIKELINNLNSTNEEVALEAERKLLDIGLEALPVLYKESEMNSSDRVSGLILDIESLGGSEGNFLETDKIILQDDSIYTGDIQADSLQIQTAYGNLKANKEQIVSLNFIIEATSGTVIKKEFKLAANSFIPVNNNNADSGFLNTKIFLKKGDKFEIRATGEVVLASLSNNKFTPEGNIAQGNWMNIPFGAVAGKIGNSGTPFLIGTKYKGVAKESGFLFLTISETVYNASNTGEYKITVNK